MNAVPAKKELTLFFILLSLFLFSCLGCAVKENKKETAIKRQQEIKKEWKALADSIVQATKIDPYLNEDKDFQRSFTKRVNLIIVEYKALNKELGITDSMELLKAK